MAKGNVLHSIREQVATIPPVEVVDLTGKTVIVIGANAGMGLETSKHFARMNPARLILACRSKEKGLAAIQKIETETGYKNAELWLVDLSDFSSVLAFVDKFEKEAGRLDILVANAAISPRTQTLTKDGWEIALQVNCLSLYLIALRLLPQLVKTSIDHSTHPRLVFVTSESHSMSKLSTTVDDGAKIYRTLNNFEKQRYNDSKLLGILFYQALNEKLGPDSRIITNGANPGFCLSEIRRDLSGFERCFFLVLDKTIARTAEEGSRQIVYAAVGGAGEEDRFRGSYISLARVAEASDFAIGPEGHVLQEKLWTLYLMPGIVTVYFLMALIMMMGTAHASPLPPSTESTSDVALHRRGPHGVPASHSLAPTEQKVLTEKECEEKIASSVHQMQQENPHSTYMDRISFIVQYMLNAEQTFHQQNWHIEKLLVYNEQAVAALMKIATEHGNEQYYHFIGQVHAKQLGIFREQLQHGGKASEWLNRAIRDANASMKSLEKVGRFIDWKSVVEPVIENLRAEIAAANNAAAGSQAQPSTTHVHHVHRDDGQYLRRNRFVGDVTGCNKMGKKKRSPDQIHESILLLDGDVDVAEVEVEEVSTKETFPDDTYSRPPRGFGQSPRGRGRGRGGFKLRPDAPLSDLLFQERPFLRPIIFVPSVQTKVLFQEEEEIFQAVVEEVGEEEKSHVPTADRVLRVFSGRSIPTMVTDGEDEEEELMELDFNDTDKLAELPTRPSKADVDVVEEKFLGIRLASNTPSAEISSAHDQSSIEMSTTNAEASVLSNRDSHSEEISITSTSVDTVSVSATLASQQETHLTSEQDVDVKMDEASVDVDSSSSKVVVDTSVVPAVWIEPMTPMTPNVVANNAVASAVPDSESFTSSLEDPSVGFYIDTEPSNVDVSHHGKPKLLEDDDDEVIVYKAENKRLRALKRLELAADPLMRKKGGKKGRKAMLAAAKLDPTITVLPNRIIDMTTLVQQIRRFIGDIGGSNTMSLPPTDKETRKNVHEMALAFNLKSVSKGKGDARYTTLSKTTRTGLFVDEKKVAKIVRRSMGGGGYMYGGEFRGSNTRGGRGGAVSMPRHKEGEEVGKAAPKIGESNIGFKMLALMGWTEGERIGVSGGIDAPITAVIKHTKLGLGATR
ncbi:hypothetical protein H0H93_003443 [Arthromyces matolae]|nr:hypothetical protein H0H93_003443 [Arthromyces matolae]